VSESDLDAIITPRVTITYDLQTGDAVESRELPLVIGVLGDFGAASHNRAAWDSREALLVDRDSFNEALDTVRPRVRFKVASSLAGGELEVDLTFRHLDDFGPGRVAEQIEPLRSLHRSDSPHDHEIVRLHLAAILEAPEFGRLEATWRGLWHLVSRIEPGGPVKVKLIDVSKAELLRDLQNEAEYDRSVLFEKVYDESFGEPEADPYALLIGDYEFGRHPQDVKLLGAISHVAAAAFAPFLAAASPDLLGLESFKKLDGQRDIAKLFEAPAYVQWRSFRQSEDSRFVGLTLPHILLRQPHATIAEPELRRYAENRSLGSSPLWGNAAFALGASIASAFSRQGWFDLKPEPGASTEITPEVKIDGHDVDFFHLGLTPLTTIQGGHTGFTAVPSCHKPKAFLSPDATAAGKSWAQLPYILAASRFTQYLTVIGRDYIGKLSPKQWEQLLNAWIQPYVLAADDTSTRHPLRDGRIEVAEVRGQPGLLRVTAHLLPRFPADKISAPHRFVSYIAQR
jgi:type VI secretion system protein ImpC